jgi:DNA-binding LacI/PurR family transcriptional regulator
MGGEDGARAPIDSAIGARSEDVEGAPEEPALTATGRPVTRMRDIAAVAGVSQSTVSRVLNDAQTSVPIAAETRERVIRAARELGYRPNPLARGLRGASTNLIGAIVRDFSDPFFAGAIEALAVEAMGRGYNVVLGHIHGRLEEALGLTSVLETRHCDAIIVLGDMQDQPRLLDDLRHSVIPVVALWQGSSPLEFPTIDVDNRAGIAAGMQHVLDLGHERIAFVSGRLPGDNPQRLDAFVDVMTARFGGVPDGFIQHVPNTLAGGEAALDALLALPEVPTAIVTSTDLVAVGVLHAAYSLGRTVPDELSVVGFDDILIAAHTVPALTTLRMPIGEMIHEGVRLATEFARNVSMSRQPQVTSFEPTLVVRQSTAPATVGGRVGREAAAVSRAPTRPSA